MWPCDAAGSRARKQAMIAEVKGVRLLLGFHASGGPRGPQGYPGARVVPRHAPRRTPGRVGHQSPDGAAERSGSEGGRRPRRVARHIALHAAECLTQKSPSSIIGQNGPLSNPTPAVEPRRREPLNLPQSGRCHPSCTSSRIEHISATSSGLARQMTSRLRAAASSRLPERCGEEREGSVDRGGMRGLLRHRGPAHGNNSPACVRAIG